MTNYLTSPLSLKLRYTSSSIHGSSQPPVISQSLQFLQYCQGLRPCRCSSASANRRVVGNKVQLASRRKDEETHFSEGKERLCTSPSNGKDGKIPIPSKCLISLHLASNLSDWYLYILFTRLRGRQPQSYLAPF